VSTPVTSAPTLTLLARVCLVVVATILLVWQLTAMNRLLGEVQSITAIRSVPYNEAVQSAVNLLVEQSTSWSQVALLLLGALAALWIAKKDEAGLALKPQNWPEIVMWLAGVGLLVASVYCHNEYLDGLAAALQAGGVTAGTTITIADVFSDKFEALRREQATLLVFGTAISVVAFFSIRNLAGEQR
jgi:hypothetical protein